MKSIRIAAAASMFVFALAQVAHGKALLGEPDVDRASDGWDHLWCPAEQHQFDGSFVADGPQVTFRFVATNHAPATGFWRHERIDNVMALPESTYLAHIHAADPALIAAYPCISLAEDFFHFSELTLGDFVFYEQFPTSPPDPAWDLTDGAYYNSASSALNSFNLPVDETGGSLGLGLDSDPSFEATTEITVDGFTAGESYVVTVWTRSDPIVGNDLVIQIFGTEFFSDVTSGDLYIPIVTEGLAWGDYDKDLDQDLYVSLNSGANVLLRNDGANSFADVTPAVIANEKRGRGVAWADYDNDGYLDLYLANVNAPNALFRNDVGVFLDETTSPLDHGDGSHDVAWVDYDTDGDVDLYVTSSSANKLFRNDVGSFADATPALLANASDGYGASWADYDNDGDPDCYLSNRNADNKLFRNDGGGAFADATTTALTGPSWSIGATWLDMDNDEDLDLFVTSDIAPCHLIRNDGSGFVSLGFSEFPRLTAVDAMAGDYDNDGDLDIYLARKPTNPNALLRNDGGIFFEHDTGSVEVFEDSRAVAWADSDGDGDVDFYIGNADDNLLFRNETGTLNTWLQVRLVGTVSNRSAIGARVRVVTSQGPQIREISGGSGRFSQSSLVASFGLGDATVVDSVVVAWPSGIVQTVTGVAVDQQVEIVEMDATDVTLVGADGSVELSPAAPNPFREATFISYTLPNAAPVELRVYEVSGRLVRKFDEGTKGAGTHRFYWDGRDSTGRQVGAGIYFYELRADEVRLARKMVRMPGR